MTLGKVTTIKAPPWLGPEVLKCKINSETAVQKSKFTKYSEKRKQTWNEYKKSWIVWIILKRVQKFQDFLYWFQDFLYQVQDFFPYPFGRIFCICLKIFYLFQIILYVSGF